MPLTGDNCIESNPGPIFSKAEQEKERQKDEEQERARERERYKQRGNYEEIARSKNSRSDQTNAFDIMMSSKGRKTERVVKKECPHCHMHFRNAGALATHTRIHKKSILAKKRPVPISEELQRPK